MLILIATIAFCELKSCEVKHTYRHMHTQRVKIQPQSMCLSRTDTVKYNLILYLNLTATVGTIHPNVLALTATVGTIHPNVHEPHNCSGYTSPYI